MATTTSTAPLDPDLAELTWLRLAFEDGSAVRIRRRAKATQAEAARSAGLSPATVSLWEALRRRPRGSEALRYAAVLRQFQALAR